MSKLYDEVMARKSVRTFDGRPLSGEVLKKIEAYIQNVPNPFGIPVTFSILDAKRHGLSSPVLAGESTYVAAKVEKGPLAEVAYGYSFERFVMYACSLGIGTVWIGGTMNRDAFEAAMDLKPNEMMPCVTPIGYAAERRSFRESLMRKGIKADTRKPHDQLFFLNDFRTPLSVDAMGKLTDAFELVRWSPSAVNKQPWRVVAKDGGYHFYEKKDKGYEGDRTGDLQKIDVGIALCHFVLGAEDAGLTPGIEVNAPEIELPQDMYYIASVKF